MTDRYDSASVDSNPCRPALTDPAQESASLPSYDSDRLLQGGREVLIRHHGEVYRLRLTRNDKLILNK